MSDISLLQSLLGGALIGCAAVLLYLSNGRIAGVSGVLGGALYEPIRVAQWRFAFLFGLVAGGVLLLFVLPRATVVHITDSMPLVVAGGLLVGYGSRLGGGCTSGHGVCGLARFSRRSLIATLTFMFTAMITVFVVRHVV